MVITQDMYSVTKQRERSLFVKINILDQQMRILDEISGNVTDGNVNVDADADIRRSCSISLIVTNSSFEIKSGIKYG